MASLSSISGFPFFPVTRLCFLLRMEITLPFHGQQMHPQATWSSMSLKVMCQKCSMLGHSELLIHSMNHDCQLNTVMYHSTRNLNCTMVLNYAVLDQARKRVDDEVLAGYRHFRPSIVRNVSFQSPKLLDHLTRSFCYDIGWSLSMPTGDKRL